MITALLSAAVLLAEATPAAQPPARVAKPQVICRSEAEFGTRLARRVCRSVADMRDRRAHDRQLADRWQDPRAATEFQPGAIWRPMNPSTLMAPVMPSQPMPAPAARGPQ